MAQDYQFKSELDVLGNQTEQISLHYDASRRYLLVLNPYSSHPESILNCSLVRNSDQEVIFDNVEVNYNNGFVFEVDTGGDHTLTCSDAVGNTNSRIQIYGWVN